MSTTALMRKTITIASLTSLLYSFSAYADSPGDVRAEFHTPNQDKVVFLKTGKSQGMLITTHPGSSKRIESYRVFTGSDPRLEITVPKRFGERGGTYDETYSIKLRSSTEAQQISDKLDFTRGRVASPAEYAEVAVQELRRARPYGVEGASTLAERRTLEEQLMKSASAIRKEGWGTYSGLRAEAAVSKAGIGEARALSTASHSSELTLESRAAISQAEVTAARTASSGGRIPKAVAAGGVETKLVSRVVRGGAAFIAVDYLAAPHTGEEPLVSQLVKGVPVAKDVDKGLQEASRIVWKSVYCGMDILFGRPCMR